MNSRPLDTLCDWLKAHDAVEATCTEEEILLLKRLDLSGRGIEALPEAFGLLDNLIALNLGNNSLSDLPESMGNITSLVNLDLRRNRFEAVAECIGPLTLKSLNMSGNRLSDISALEATETLKVLDLSGNKLTRLNGKAALWKGIRNLNLSYNFIEESDELFLNLTEIELLYFTDNLLVKIPSETAAMSMLGRLDLSGNQIAEISDAFYTLELEYLDLSSNRLTHLHLQQLEDLEALILDDNPLERVTFDHDFAMHLRTFSCEGCGLKEMLLPPSRFLQELCFSSNALKRIPEDILEYSDLKELDLDHNELTALPEGMARLRELNILYISENPLSEKSRKSISRLDVGMCDLNIAAEVYIRRAQLDDLRVLAHMVGQLFSIESDFSINFYKQHEGLKCLFECDDADILVAKYKNSVIGMVTMQKVISSAEGGFAGLVEDFFIHEEFRSMGIGAKLLSEIVELAHARKYVRIQLAADKGNSRALKFYNQHGFRKTNLTIYHLRELNNA